ncbi:hypothetical protein L3Q67_32615 [Saccharothrix sp. AJ9571]|nr:hypothetical protein L3Q67_32615 [Saccharothrix sp. AJ9571]
MAVRFFWGLSGAIATADARAGQPDPFTVMRLIVTWSGETSAGAADLGMVIADRAMALAVRTVKAPNASIVRRTSGLWLHRMDSRVL